MDAVKLVDVDKGLIEGWAIPFGGPMPGEKDLDGEAFTKETELYLDNYPSRPHPLPARQGFTSGLQAYRIGSQGDAQGTRHLARGAVEDGRPVQRYDPRVAG